MNHTLEIEELEDRARWLQDRYDEALRNFIGSFEYHLADAKRELEREIVVAGEDNRLLRTHSYQAGYVVRAMLQAIPNAHTDNLMSYAADLDEVKRAIIAREEYLKTLPVELREEIEVFDTERRLRKDEAARAKAAEREEKIRTRCKYGAGLSSGQCSRKGAEEIEGKLYCKQHAKIVRARKGL